MLKNGLNRLQYLGGVVAVPLLTWAGEYTALSMGADWGTAYTSAVAFIMVSWIALVGMRFRNMGRSWAWGLTAFVPALLSIPVLIWGFFGKPQQVAA